MRLRFCSLLALFPSRAETVEDPEWSALWQFNQLIEWGADVNASVDPVEFPTDVGIQGIPRPLDALQCAACLSGGSTDCFLAAEILIECGLMHFGTSLMLQMTSPHSVLVLVTTGLLSKYASI